MNLKPNKSLGQNFLHDEEVIRDIVEASELTKDDLVIEIGAGKGILSKALAPHVKNLLSLEIDDRLIPIWEQVMKRYPNATIMHQDALLFIPPEKHYKVIANIPYYITSPLLKQFLRHQDGKRPDLIVFMIQKEVAERILNEKAPTLLSWEVRIFGSPSLVRVVEPSSFTPSPKVDSAVLKIQVYKTPMIPEKYLHSFFQLLSLGYRQPRKTILNNLTASGRMSKDRALAMLEKIHIDPKYRPHQLSLTEWQSMLREAF